MTFYEIWVVFMQGILPVSTPLVVVCIILSFICSLFAGQSIRTTLPIIIAFGFVGGVAGFSAGLSRVPVVGTVIPAMLTLISGVFGYMFSKESMRSWRTVIQFCIAVLAINCFIGLFIGSQMRGKSEEYDKKYNEWLLHYERVELEAEKAEALNTETKENELEKHDDNR